MENYDYLIVGAGLAGSIIAERIATQLNKSVLIVEKRNHIAGNCYDYHNEKGILVHRYGPHAFHTNMKHVWDYLSQFTEWHPYEHRVLVHINGKDVPVPFNLNSIEKIFPPAQAELYKNKLIEKYGQEKKIPILKLRETDDNDLKELAEFIYQNVFYGYTLKQWGMSPEDLDFSVTSRVPVHISRDDRYFQDKYQGVPIRGYTKMIEKIIDHPNITVKLTTDYKKINDSIFYDKLIYTGPIDYFFDYEYGKLPYRSLRFDFKTLKQEYFQPVSQINFPNNHQYTRITEFKHFLKQRNIAFTTISYEYPQEYIPNMNEPYYSIPKKENDELYQKYLSKANDLNNVIFVGRLAEYKYYNMDQIVGVALKTFDDKIKKDS